MTTPSQTVGPFFGFALPYAADWELVPEGHPGAVTITGVVLDGAGEPVPDALLELWTGEPGERGALSRKGAGASGFGRCGTAPDGSYRFRLAPPSRPYAALLVFARGLLKPVRTRVYFADAPDPLLGSLDPARRATLLARPEGQDVYRFDVRLQGERETVFLEF
ncbi:protocatechuate 3,4-dioxygenase subunit alpha [Microbispora hainanensis]|uniref:Protocatechuate 3,4-dioxygenase subunit alpha n=1 Tax=Microbispora hainanensis TaxID=568844 RepID=A0ABZ1SVK8_9ACTN|nr:MULTISPECIES: protocatechuate 3,4-dioxygenase subunit alpha [Microbispora]NJP26034.1 protocatechuate 3,4-dioxygenase subunit alpha [Microbispora sp. CL1-1]TQS12809.1 protocatechuate 3,4-dioxygenase subunit alpha [Microbispora sp. SCL1-1]